MRKLGISVSDFGASQLSYLIVNNVNEYMKKDYKIDIIGFYENLTKYSFDPQFSCMQAVELWGYDGPVIATNINSAEDILKIPTIKKKLFYIYNLDWVDIPDKDYQKLKYIYSNPNLILIARCEEYQDIINKIWNVNVQYVVEDFKIEELLEIAK